MRTTLLCSLWNAGHRLGGHPLWLPVVMMMSYVHAAICPDSTLTWRDSLAILLEDVKEAIR